MINFEECMSDLKANLGIHNSKGDELHNQILKLMQTNYSKTFKGLMEDLYKEEDMTNFLNKVEIFPFSMYGLKVKQKDPLAEPAELSYSRRHRTLTIVLMPGADMHNDRAVRLMSSLNTSLTIKSDIVVFAYDKDNVIYSYGLASNVPDLELNNIVFKDLPDNPTFEKMFADPSSHYTHVMFHMDKKLLIHNLKTEKEQANKEQS